MEEFFASCQMFRHKPVSVRAFQARVEMEIIGLPIIKPGDWVIMQGGQMSSMTNEEFRSQYDYDPSAEIKVERKRRRSSRKQRGLAPGAGLAPNGSAETEAVSA